MKKILTPQLIFTGGVVLVGIVFTLNQTFPQEKRLPADMLTAYFTGLGFAGLIASIWSEKAKTEEAEKEHSELIAAMRADRRVAVIATKLQHRRENLYEANRNIPEGLKLFNQSHVDSDEKIIELLAELNALLNHTEPKKTHVTPLP